MPVASSRRPQNRIHPGSIFVIPGGAPGLVIPGNINLWRQPVVRNKDGSYSTVRSLSYTLNDGPYKLDNGRVYKTLEVLVPSAYGGKVDFSKFGPYRHYASTGRHLGIFDTPAHANAYANRLHLWYVKEKKWFVPPPIRRK